MLFMGILFLVVGAALRIFVRARQFNRTNQHGVEEFTSTTGFFLTSGIERILCFVANIAIALGALLCFLSAVASTQ